MNYKNIVYGSILILLSIIVILISLEFPSYVVRGQELPGPSFFPQVISIFLILIGIYEIILGILQTFKLKKLNEEGLKKEEKVIKTVITKKGLFNIIVVIAGIILFVPFINLVGFKLGLFIFSTILMTTFGVRLLRALIYSAIVTVIIILIFAYLFKIPFPEGILFSF